MPKFKYVGFTSDGKKVENSIEADNVRDAKKILRRQNIRPLKIQAPSFFEADLGEFLVEKGLARPYGQAELMRFTRQLSILINAGVPILECMDILSRQEQNMVLKRVVKNTLLTGIKIPI
jgi:type IV pilus assembly protein PilC